MIVRPFHFEVHPWVQLLQSLHALASRAVATTVYDGNQALYVSQLYYTFAKHSVMGHRLFIIEIESVHVLESTTVLVNKKLFAYARTIHKFAKRNAQDIFKSCLMYHVARTFQNMRASCKNSFSRSNQHLYWAIIQENFTNPEL